MKRKPYIRILSCLLVIVLLAPAALAAEPLEAGHWDLTELFVTQADFEAGLKELEAKTAALAGYAGKLKDADTLYRFFCDYEQTMLLVDMLGMYGTLRLHPDLSNAQAQKNEAAAISASTNFFTTFTLLDTELLKVSPSLYETCKGQERFNPYIAFLEYYQEGLPENRPSDDVLTTLASLSFLTGLPEKIQNIVEITDFRMERVVNLDGIVIQDPDLLSDEDYKEFEANAYYATLDAHGNTLAATLNAYMQLKITEAGLYGMDPLTYCIEAEFGMPAEAASLMSVEFSSMAGELVACKNLMAERGLSDELNAYEEPTFTYDEAANLILAALEPLGEEYIGYARQMLYGTHIDAVPGEYKYGGAYAMSGYWEGPPYILMSFEGDYYSVLTLAHELGHAVAHLYRQNYLAFSELFPLTEGYVYAVDEVFSTINEQLLGRYMIENSKSPEEALYYLWNEYDYAFSMSFQAQLHEFQSTVMTRAAEGEYLTKEALNELYGRLEEKYYGTPYEEGAVRNSYWGVVSHFYTGFYVFNYATCYAASIYFADQVLAGEPEDYIKLLTSSSKLTPMERFSVAGIDMTDAAIYESMHAYIAELLEPLKAAALELPVKEAEIETVTRAKAAFDIVQALGLKPGAARTVADMSPLEAYYPYVSAAIEYKLMVGAGGGCFMGGRAMTWGEAAGVLKNAAAYADTAAAVSAARERNSADLISFTEWQDLLSLLALPEEEAA